MKLIFSTLRKWHHGQVAKTPAGQPHAQGRTQPGPTHAPIQQMIFKIVKCHERASVFYKMTKKFINYQKGISVLCIKWQWIICNLPTRKRKMMSHDLLIQQWQEFIKLHHPNQNMVLWWNQTKSGSNALIPKRASTIKRHSHQQNKALTSHAICLQKVTSRQK